MDISALSDKELDLFFVALKRVEEISQRIGLPVDVGEVMAIITAEIARRARAQIL